MRTSVHGQPKKEVTLDYVVDLRTPGIEKIRLTPRGIDNGEVQLEIDHRRDSSDGPAHPLTPGRGSFVDSTTGPWASSRRSSGAA